MLLTHLDCSLVCCVGQREEEGINTANVQTETLGTILRLKYIPQEVKCEILLSQIHFGIKKKKKDLMPHFP